LSVSWRDIVAHPARPPQAPPPDARPGAPQKTGEEDVLSG
jgi:hypothetical protein